MCKNMCSITFCVTLLCLYDNIRAFSPDLGSMTERSLLRPLLRQKRFLTFPQTSPTRVQLIYGVGLPVILQQHSVTVGYVFKAQYLLPVNASDFRPNIDFSRRERTSRDVDKQQNTIDVEDGRTEPKSKATRWSVYKGIEAIANSYGLEGRACVLRAICEAAENPFTHSNGILGELIHVVLTPSTTQETLEHHIDNEYFAAEKIGKQAKSLLHLEGYCGTVFSECQTSLLDLFTSVEYIYKTLV